MAMKSQIDLSKLDGSNGYRLDGPAKNGGIGYNVSTGDFNRDGFADIYIGSVNTSTIYTVFGHQTNDVMVFDLKQLDDLEGFKISNPHNSSAGEGTSSAGDFNGDGYNDLIFSAPGINKDVGQVNIVMGSDSGIITSLVIDSPYVGPHKNDFAGRLGYDASGAGDINGDGYDDVIFSAIADDDLNGDNKNQSNEIGQTYVLFGHPGSISGHIALNNLSADQGILIEGGYPTFVSRLGDINADGFDDFGVGSPEGGRFQGRGYVVFGRESWMSPVSFSDGAVIGAAGFSVEGLAANSRLQQLSAAGDLNGDGYADVAFGAYGKGVSYVLFGRSEGFSGQVNLAGLNGANGFTLTGGGKGLGWALSSAGDFNGDGFQDFLAAALQASPKGHTSAGSAFLIYGHAGPWAPSINLAHLDPTEGVRIDGLAKGDALGTSASSGDVNGDGLSDLVLSAPGADSNGRTDTGSVYVIYGSPASAAVHLIGSAIGQAMFGSDFNDTIEGIGGDDRLLGEAGDDTLLGGQGNDSLYGGVGKDLLDGGDGSDTVIYDDATSSVFVNLGIAGFQDTGGGGTDKLKGLENVFGSDFDDVLVGNAGRNLLIGGYGSDTLTGGGGVDRFTYRVVAESIASAPDLIVDLTGTDVIDLKSIDADTSQAGDQAFHRIGLFTHNAGELVLIVSGSDTLIEGDVDGDGLADLVIHLTGNHTSFTNFEL